jgi:hypothetical protein
VRAIICAALLALCAAALSQEPTPGTGEGKGNPPQKHTTGSDQPPAQDKQGTQGSSLSINITNTQAGKNDRQEHRAERQEKSSPDWWIISLTGVLALATLLQFGALLWQGCQLKRAVDATKEEFIAAHRPRIRVRNFVLDVAPAIAGGDAPLEIQKANTFEIVNVGGTRAKIKEYGCRIHSGNRLPMQRPARGEIARVLDIILGPGESASLDIPKGGLTSGDLNTIGVYILGWIGYSDAAESPRIRRTGFCRKYDPTRGRFFPLNDEPDYEYED